MKKVSDCVFFVGNSFVELVKLVAFFTNQCVLLNLFPLEKVQFLAQK